MTVLPTDTHRQPLPSSLTPRNWIVKDASQSSHRIKKVVAMITGNGALALYRAAERATDGYELVGYFPAPQAAVAAEQTEAPTS